MAKKKKSKEVDTISFFDMLCDNNDLNTIDYSKLTYEPISKEVENLMSAEALTKALMNEDFIDNINESKKIPKEKHKNEIVNIESKKKKGKFSDEDLLLHQENLGKTLDDRYSNNIEAIKTLNSITEDMIINNRINDNEKKKLGRFSGWGGHSKKFEKDTESNELLKELLGNERYEDAKASTLTSFYTPLCVIKFIYKVLDRMGFDKGKILDPSTGTGRFLGAMNDEMYYRSNITALEPDPVSYKISKILYANSNIINSKFEEADLRDNGFDVVTSNIPFGNFKVYDEMDKELNEYKLTIHNYFFMKALKKLRVGGILAFVTTSATLDNENENFRTLINDRCDFLGAVRLPKNAFLDTQVSTDIIFLQKTERRNTKFEFIKIEDKTNIIMNEYFHNHPEMIIGDISMERNKYGDLKMVSKLSGKLSGDNFKNLVSKFEEEIYEAPLTDDYMFAEDEILMIEKNSSMEEIRKGEYITIDNLIYRRDGNKLYPVKLKGKRYDIFKKYITIKDLFNSLINIQVKNFNLDKFKNIQKELNKQYDQFVKSYGFLSLRKNKIILGDDVLYISLTTLEVYDYRNDTYYKSDIFTKRSLKTIDEKEIKTPIDAYKVCMRNKGYLDINYIFSLLPKMDENEITRKLCEDNLMYYIPYKHKYMERTLFESGETKDRLKRFEEGLNETIKQRDLEKDNEIIDKLNLDISHYEKGIDTLKLNQPEYITDVFFSMSTTWIPLKVKKKFIADTLDLDEDDIELLYTSSLGYSLKCRTSPEFVKECEWGTKATSKTMENEITRGRTALNIAENTLNMKDITITYKVEDANGDERTVKDVEATQASRNMQEKWKLEFVSYIKSNIELYDSMLKLYNKLYNNTVERKYFNIFEDLEINPNIKPRTHQLLGASRVVLSKNNTLLAHSVGSGKTYTMILAAQELKRMSTLEGTKSVKNLFIIPNSLCESGQFAKDYLTMFPNANILPTTSKDFTKANRRKIIGKIITCDWDAIIIPHSTLIKIPLKPETERKLINEDIEELREIHEFYLENGKKSSIKDIENSIKKLEVKLKKLNDTAIDEGIFYWDNLGITNIFIDEAHNFKNLDFPTKLQAAGINNTDAKKTKDLYNKIRLFKEENGERGLVFATATPISNSMCELYTMMKYLMKEELERFGVRCFDEWSSIFGEIETTIEIDVTGTGFKSRQRFSKFHNVSELITLFRIVADIVHIENIEDINAPKLKGGKPITVTIEPTEAMMDKIEELVNRSQAIERREVEPDEDNMLVVTTEGRMLTVSPRLVGIDEDSVKVEACVENLVRINKEYPETTHLVFCDMGTPTSKRYCVYHEIKEKLLKAGFNKDEVVYIHDGSTDLKKKEIVDKYNAGLIKVLIGSTSKMGEGMNLQKKTKSLHHISAPWRPSDIEQRVGRMVRQGNENTEVEEYRYVIKNSFDAFSWQIIQKKAEMIIQILNADKTIRDVEDLADSAMTAAETKAAACGDNRILELNTLQHEHKKLVFLEKSFNTQKLNIHNRVKDNERYLKLAQQNIPKLQEDIKIMAKAIKNNNIITFYDYDNECRDMNEVKKIMKDVYEKNKPGLVGAVYGLKIYYNKAERLLYVGDSNMIKIKFNNFYVTMLKNLFNIKNTVKDLYKNKVEQYNKILHENDELKFKLNAKFEYEDKLKEVSLKIKQLEDDLLLNQIGVKTG